ncbi:hypothetical protein ES319_A11G128500v1 [Gossypium barbadense]|uniref:Uncharacterized protein n=1 Tax=Gossypium barbadense TaxID=3634 RepID=A0A5J5TMJ8_GOSBA|nr:hypothetical protein ES319_A11G128500v1 [Gossypium barbadense]
MGIAAASSVVVGFGYCGDAIWVLTGFCNGGVRAWLMVDCCWGIVIRWVVRKAGPKVIALNSFSHTPSGEESIDGNMN